MNIAINGFGRIGRNFLRTLLCDNLAQKKMAVSAINIGPASLESIAHLFKYDSLLGMYPGVVFLRNNKLCIDEIEIEILQKTSIEDIFWNKYKVEWVVESSGEFTDRANAQKHLAQGASRVLVTAPMQGDDITIIAGVNDDSFDFNNHFIVSLGSCTSNAFMPIIKIMNDVFGMVSGQMTTVHAYTNSQVLLDGSVDDLRRSRAAALNIIPAGTGADKIIGQLFPDLKGKITACALRVPTPKVSVIDFSFVSKEPLTVAQVNEAFAKKNLTQAARDVVDITYEQLVSTDFYNNDASVIVDALLTSVAGSHMAKIFGWYDNEWGFSMRLKDFLHKRA